MNDSPHYHGHRQRLRGRLLEQGGPSLADYELLEFLLFGARPRGDVKPLAKELIKRFGSLAAVLSAQPQRLLSVPGMGESSAAAIAVVAEAARRMARAETRESPVLSSWQKLIDYCRITLAHEAVECLHLLFLDRKNRLIADEVQQRGTVDQAPLYVREVMKRALELGASAIILVHNHPSGDPTPSKADIEITREVGEAARRLGIQLHDHVIVARQGESSFKTLGLL